MGRRNRRLLVVVGGLVAAVAVVLLLALAFLGTSMDTQDTEGGRRAAWSIRAQAGTEAGTEETGVRILGSLSPNNNAPLQRFPAFSLSHVPDKKFFSASSINGARGHVRAALALPF